MKQVELKSIAERYATFATDEARGSSEAYERLAVAVAQSNDLLEFIATLPVERRQPILFLAAPMIVGFGGCNMNIAPQ